MNNAKSKSKNNKALLVLTVTLLVILIITGFNTLKLAIENNELRYKLEQLTYSYDALSSDYESLKSKYDALRNDYNKLTSDYNKLLSDYSKLNDEYNKLFSAYNELLAKYNELVSIVKLEEHRLIEEDKPVQIPAYSKTSLSYYLEYAGYIEITFSATGDVYFYVGNGDYWVRYPLEGSTTSGKFIVPVLPGYTYLWIYNPSLLSGVSVTISIKYRY